MHFRILYLLYLILSCLALPEKNNVPFRLFLVRSAPLSLCRFSSLSLPSSRSRYLAVALSVVISFSLLPSYIHSLLAVICTTSIRLFRPLKSNALKHGRSHD